MTRRFFSGNTLEQTVMTAARHYGVDPEELAYRQIEKRHGFLRTRKAVMIAVDPENPRRQPEAPAAPPEPRAAAPAAPAAPAPAEKAGEAPVGEAGEAPFGEAGAQPAPEDEPEAPAEDDGWRPAFAAPPAAAPPAEAAPAAQAAAAPAEVEVEDHGAGEAAPAPEIDVDDEELLRAAENAARTLMRFAGIEAEASARWGDERVEVEIEGSDSSVLVVEGGKGLLAIQHLLPRMMRGQTGRSSFVRVDSQGFHQNRRERLEALALKEAEAVSRNGTARTLPPMAPDERRIVHLAVKDIPTVVTESRGTGLHKRVVIRPVTGDGGHDDIEARHGF